MDTLIQKIFFKIIKIINFRGDLTDNSVKKEALPATVFNSDTVLIHVLLTSVAVLAEISLRLPRKVFTFIIKKYVYSIKVSKNILI